MIIIHHQDENFSLYEDLEGRQPILQLETLVELDLAREVCIDRYTYSWRKFEPSLKKAVIKDQLLTVVLRSRHAKANSYVHSRVNYAWEAITFLAYKVHDVFPFCA